MVVLILTTFLIVVALVRHLMYLYRMESYVKHLKSTHPLLPIVGTAYGMIGKSATDAYKEILRFAKSNDTPVKTYIGSTLALTVDKPEDIKIILSSPICFDKPFVFDFLPYRAGIFTTTLSAVWKPIRKHLNPTFSLNVLQSFMPIFNKKSTVLLEKMDTEVGKEEFNVFPYIQWSILDAICETTMGFDLKTQSHLTADFFNSMDAFFCLVLKRFIKPWFHADFIYQWTPMYKIGQNHSANVRLLTNAIFETKKEEYLAENNNDMAKAFETTEKKPQNAIDKLLKLCDDGEFDEDLAKEQIETILVAGNDTSTATVSFTILMLAMHPEIQERLYQELRSVFSEQNEDMSQQHLNQMPYLDLVLKETLRLFPAAPYPLRCASADITIDSCTIPKDAMILLSIFSLHRRQDVWGADADQFNPDHFLPEHMSQRHPFAFIPFGAGQRNCIGYRYAMISMKVMLSALLRRYKFTTNLKLSDIDLRFEMVLKLAQKHMVQIERRRW
ncbi:cytochrome P450 4c3-like [Sitodiplosis mosellana]|uniref:cytochrome P450 4c3-like n=1 Tax=Sitodiplosis mosellana TaxID=263140 RepID=UPI002444F715|nr:cytochrome P450 4c3-like [Sitodiplosis mosellana]